MSLTLELLRMETDREPLFWPFNAGNGLISAVPHDCPKAKKASNTTADPALVNNNNNNNNASTKVLNGLSQHKRHSYYECCVNVEVSALLEHWLGWDDKNHHCSSERRTENNISTLHSADNTTTISNMSSSTPTKSSSSWADRLVSHLVTGHTNDRNHPTVDDQQQTDDDPSIWVRKFCSEVGCDVLKKQDTNGKTLLHHLLSGAVKRNLASTALILLEAGTPSHLADLNGDTPLHLIRNLMSHGHDQDQIDMAEVCELVRVLLEKSANENLIDLPDAKGRSLLSYAVEAGDRCAPLTRLLINLGAKTFSEKLGHTSSCFAWFLRAQMQKMGAEVTLDEDTFYVLSTAMLEEVGGQSLRFKSIIDRSMVAMGSSPEAHGPLFRRIRGLAAAYWLQPPQLRLLATKSIRRSLGPKRLSKEVLSRLKVPRKLQRFVTLEEKINS